jgi:hypothetical protein
VSLALAAFGGVAWGGCRSGRQSTDIAVVAPVVPPTPIPEPPLPAPSATPPPPAFVSMLEIADQAFEVGDYATALEGYRTHLEGDVTGIGADRALYRVAVLHLVNGGPARDPSTGYALLRRLIREHPDSPYRMEAEVILGLTARVDGLETEIERLENQLEALKRIDLDLKPDRPPPPPP